MRRTTGAILIETRPDRMIRSAWRGEKRIASAPMRARSTRGEPITEIISIAQQDDEGDQLAERKGPVGLELDCDREQKHDFDVEQDEEHRNQVEADPEAE